MVARPEIQLALSTGQKMANMRLLCLAALLGAATVGGAAAAAHFSLCVPSYLDDGCLPDASALSTTSHMKRPSARQNKTTPRCLSCPRPRARTAAPDTEPAAMTTCARATRTGSRPTRCSPPAAAAARAATAAPWSAPTRSRGWTRPRRRTRPTPSRSARGAGCATATRASASASTATRARAAAAPPAPTTAVATAPASTSPRCVRQRSDG